ncbi:hypothetical protein D3C71_1769680 [compost metagenome]
MHAHQAGVGFLQIFKLGADLLDRLRQQLRIIEDHINGTDGQRAMPVLPQGGAYEKSRGIAQRKDENRRAPHQKKA